MKSCYWTSDEIELLKKNYTKLGPQGCSTILNRSIRGCAIKAKKLNLKFNRGSRYDFDILSKIVKESKSKLECFKKLKLHAVCAGNLYTLNKYIKLYNLDTSHFENKSYQNKNAFINNKKPISEILVENSTYNTTNLKDRLYKEGLKERKCEICGQGEEWNGKHMSLILDHINGISNDHRLDNLRIVCPNCNATLETHCRGAYKKNKKPKTYKTCECGNIIKEKRANHCVKCALIKQRKVERPPYEQLLDEIKKSSYVQVGKKYDVSDNTIRKWIKYYNKHAPIV
jgi:hypothetical protein